MSEAFVEEEFSEVGEGGKSKGVEGRDGITRGVGGIVGYVSETQLCNMGCGGGGGVGEVVADDAVWGGGAEIIGIKGAPWNVGVDGLENPVH